MKDSIAFPAFVAVVVFACVPLGHTADPKTQLSEADIVGVWKLCYEPVHSRAQHLSTGYLILMPGGRYFEMRQDCCGPASRGVEARTYILEGNDVVLNDVNVYGQECTRRFRFRQGVEVVLFDMIKQPPIRTDVLQIGENLDAGYARVYPSVPFGTWKPEE